MNFALLSVHSFITGTVYNFTAESAAPLREASEQSPQHPRGRAWAGDCPLRGTSGAILLQEDTVQLNFNRQLNGFVAFFPSNSSSLFMWKFIIFVNTEGKSPFESFCIHCSEVQHDRQRDEFPWLSVMCMFAGDQLQPAEEQYVCSSSK